MTEFVLASHNLRKHAELVELLAPYGHQLRSYPDALPQEGTISLQANALHKAQVVHAAWPNAWVLADDTGLFLAAKPDALGVSTHRQLPAVGTNTALLAMLTPQMSRRCELRSTLVIQAPSGDIQSATGSLAATLATKVRGEWSRGFDRLLIPVGEALTLAEMPLSIRQAYLPRQRALAQLFI
ncbi:non-canonical purine NTP pyrophosphatase [Lacticaseibacillus jixiensis]|uniref:non-canonical purine NTP pyrophosphatase n=1 Tax=Lacticaseibacillus jixiensis TaxID=3231926 RepID=UPI0036F3E3A6